MKNIIGAILLFIVLAGSIGFYLGSDTIFTKSDESNEYYDPFQKDPRNPHHPESWQKKSIIIPSTPIVQSSFPITDCSPFRYGCVSYTLHVNKLYYVKNIKVRDKAYPVAIDIEQYKVLKATSNRVFNKESLQWVFTPYSETLTQVVDALKRDYQGAELAQALLEFTYYVGYEDDPYNNYWYGNNLTQYGEVTLMEGGDCLNLSILLLNLYYIAQIDAILIGFRDHATVGVAIETTGDSITVEGKKYYIADPAHFTQIGVCHSKYRGKPIIEINKVAMTSKGLIVRVIKSYQWNRG